MEVHHHGHIPFRKKWKEYLFQFLMLFLAVFLGFLAENRREHGVERNMEKEYIQSLVKDLHNDTLLTSERSVNINAQVKMIDSLQTLFSPKPENGSEDIKKCYGLSYFIRIYYTVAFNEKTISQLISSGNMRLIRTRGVADSIMEYYNLIKNINEQKQLYYNYVNRCLETMYNVFDISFLRTSVIDGSLVPVNVAGDRFLTNDPLEFKKLSANVELAKVTASLFSDGLLYLKEKAIQLFLYLKEEYNIKDL